MKTIVYFSPMVPPEWIAAHGLRPERPPTTMTAPGSAASRRGVCPCAGSIVDYVMSHPTASGFVFTTTCDQMRYGAALVRHQSQVPTFLLNVPSTWRSTEARRLYREELERLGRFLAGRGGVAPTKEVLAQTMREFDALRAAAAIGAAADDGDRVPLAVVGGPLLEGDGNLFDLVAQAGGRVVIDASEWGERTLPARFDSRRMADDPLGELASAYFDAMPGAFRRPNTRLYEWLGARLAERPVRGILLWRYVFCDLWRAEWGRLREWSPLPVLDIDVVGGDDGQRGRVLGRMEAFLEMLR